MVDCARLNDFKVHQQQVGGGQHIDPQTDQNNRIKNFTVFAGHGVLDKLTNGKVKLAFRLLYCQG
jgi:hypothetical protein